MGGRTTSETTGLSHTTWVITMPEFHDNINPSHYRANRKFEPIEVIEDWNLNYRLGNAVKYISRSGHKDKDKTQQDLQKAVWYILRHLGKEDRYKVLFN